MKKLQLFFLPLILPGQLFSSTINISTSSNKTLLPTKVDVSATKIEVIPREIKYSSTTIDEVVIKNSTDTSIHSIIDKHSGIYSTGIGNNTRTTSLFLRGHKSGHVLVLIDGVEMNDPLDPGNRRYDFSYLSSTNIEKIEIVPGAGSIRYGSDAIGGIINITTKNGTNKSHSDLLLSYESYNTSTLQTTTSGKASKYSYSLGADISASSGNSASAKGSEEDGYKQANISAKVTRPVLKNSSITASTRYIQNRTEIDDWWIDDINDYSEAREIYAMTSFDTFFFDGIVSSKFALSHSTHDRTTFEVIDSIDLVNVNKDFKATKNKAENINDIYLGSTSSIMWGIEHEEENGKSNFSNITSKNITNQSLFLIANQSFGKLETSRIGDDLRNQPGDSPVSGYGFGLKGNHSSRTPGLYFR